MKKTFFLIILIFSLFICLFGCNSSIVVTDNIVTSIHIQASVLSSQGGCIYIRENSATGDIITTASVKVNGINFPYDSLYGYYYLWGAPFHADEGETVNVVVSWNGMTVTGYGVIPYAPTITSPTSTSSYHVNAEMTVKWEYDSILKQPDWIEVSSTPPNYLSNSISGNVNTYIIPSNTFTVTDNGMVYIYLYNNGLTFTGSASNGSNILTRSLKAVQVTTIP